MKKMIVALDGLNLSDAAIEYSVVLAKMHHAHLVGIFLDDVTYHSYKIHDLAGPEGVLEEKRERLEAEDIALRETSVQKFTEHCNTAGINYTIHHKRNIALQELLHESIYADLLTIGKDETFTHYAEQRPTRFIKELLEGVQCPVLIVPPQYRPINQVCLLYDGGPSAVFAIKMFNYVLPQLGFKESVVVSVNKPGDSLHVPDNRLMKEFMKRHFPEARYTVLKGDAETEILRHMRTDEGNTLIVMGAYRRGMVSRWFRPSMADILMAELKHPLFIAHNK